MSWVKAGQYCRKNYVDLATVRNAEDLQQLYSIKSNSTGWTGLSDRRYSWLTINEDTNSWKWSFTYTSTYHPFKSGEPDFKNDNEACVRMESDGRWTDQPCSSLNDFLCLTGKRRFRINVILYQLLSDRQRVSLWWPLVRETLSERESLSAHWSERHSMSRE